MEVDFAGEAGSSRNHLNSTFSRLADFFEHKDDAPLTASEVNVCLEWLQSITETVHSLGPIFTTPIPSIDGPKAVASEIDFGKQTDMTPVKRQIRELLQSATPASSAAKATALPSGTTDMDLDSTESIRTASQTKNVVFKEPFALLTQKRDMRKTPEKEAGRGVQPIAMTRTAKTIMNALTRPVQTTPEKTQLILELAPATSGREVEETIATTTNATTKDFDMRVESRWPTFASTEADLPSFSFDINPNTTNRVALEITRIGDDKLPSFTFE